MFRQKSPLLKEQNPVYKYYLEVVGASKDLYTVKANRVLMENGYYAFVLDNDLTATYPISRTIIKSIELKSE